MNNLTSRRASLLPLLVLTLASCAQPLDTTPSPALAAVHLDSAAVQLRVGDSIRIGARALDGQGVAVATPVHWVSRQPAVAAVDDTGLIRAMSVGHTYIFASVANTIGGTLSDSVLVMVVPFISEPNVVVISPVSATLAPGDTIVFVSTATGTSRGPLIWSVGDSSILRLRAPVVTGNGAAHVVGEARSRGATRVTVRAQSTGQYTEANVTVQ